jgi:hypothetical protein
MPPEKPRGGVAWNLLAILLLAYVIDCVLLSAGGCTSADGLRWSAAAFLWSLSVAVLMLAAGLGERWGRGK